MGTEHAVIRAANDDLLPPFLGEQAHQLFVDRLEKRRTLLSGHQQRRRRDFPDGIPIDLGETVTVHHSLKLKSISQNVLFGDLRELVELRFSTSGNIENRLNGLFRLPFLECRPRHFHHPRPGFVFQPSATPKSRNRAYFLANPTNNRSDSPSVHLTTFP